MDRARNVHIVIRHSYVDSAHQKDRALNSNLIEVGSLNFRLSLDYR